MGQNKENKFIQTIPKKCYRFVANVKKIFEEEKETEVKNEENQQLKEVNVIPDKVLKRYSSRWYLVAIILVAILFVTCFGFWTKYRGDGELSTVPVNKRNIKSIAVLPLKSLSESTESKALLLWITDSLIGRLGKLTRFAVRPLSALDKFNDSDMNAIEFGESLKVDAVLVGTFQTNENRLRVNVRLLDVRDGAQIWSNSKYAKYVSPILLAAAALALDKERESLKWLEQANQEHKEFLPFIDIDLIFKTLRDNSQFQELVAKVKK